MYDISFWENQNQELTRIYLLAITGLYDVDYRIVAACRNGTLCNIKRGWNEAKVIALLESQVCCSTQNP